MTTQLRGGSGPEIRMTRVPEKEQSSHIWTICSPDLPTTSDPVICFCITGAPSACLQLIKGKNSAQNGRNVVRSRKPDPLLDGHRAVVMERCPPWCPRVRSHPYCPICRNYFNAEAKYLCIFLLNLKAGSIHCFIDGCQCILHELSGAKTVSPWCVKRLLLTDTAGENMISLSLKKCGNKFSSFSL